MIFAFGEWYCFAVIFAFGEWYSLREFMGELGDNVLNYHFCDSKNITQSKIVYHEKQPVRNLKSISAVLLFFGSFMAVVFRNH